MKNFNGRKYFNLKIQEFSLYNLIFVYYFLITLQIIILTISIYSFVLIFPNGIERIKSIILLLLFLATIVFQVILICKHKKE